MRIDHSLLRQILLCVESEDLKGFFINKIYEDIGSLFKYEPSLFYSNYNPSNEEIALNHLEFLVNEARFVKGINIKKQGDWYDFKYEVSLTVDYGLTFDGMNFLNSIRVDFNKITDYLPIIINN